MAKKGIPAPNFSLGMKAWDAEITARYHRLSDEVGNMDLGYVVKFIRAYIRLPNRFLGQVTMRRLPTRAFPPLHSAWE